MARVFISHSSLDNVAAEEIKRWLNEVGFDAPFLDTDPQDGIAPGADWERMLYRELDRADALLVVLTANWMASKWCFVEFAQARALGKPIFPVVEAPSGERLVGSDIQVVDLLADRHGGLARLERALRQVVDDMRGGFRLPPGRAPYPGLLAFQEDDAAIYFGRDEEVRRALELLRAQRAFASPNVMVVFGGSGTGKSSLLRAGILPQLKAGDQPWLVTPIWRLRNRPVETFALVLALALGDLDGASDWARRLDGDPDAALAEAEHRARARAGSAEAQIFVPIDQAEELFSLENSAAAAVWRVMTAAARRRSGFVLLLTLRSDFLDRFQAVLRRAFDIVLFPLDPLPADRIADIIRRPGKVANIRVDEGFVQAAMRDAGTRYALPLLAFALREIFDARRGESHWTLASYDALGDPLIGRNPIENAVRRAADRVIASLPAGSDAEELVRRLFVEKPRLVKVGDEGRYTRHAVTRGELDDASGALCDALIDARLLVTNEDGIVEVAHEALFTSWDLLAKILVAQHDFLLGLQQLNRDLAEAEQARRIGATPDLLTGLKLARAREWLATRKEALNAEQKRFVRFSIEAARRARRRKMLVLCGGIAAVLALAAAGFVLLTERRTAKVALLINEARTDLGNHRFAAAGARAAEADGKASSVETRSLLMQMMIDVSGHLAWSRSLGALTPLHVAWSPDGGRIVAADVYGHFVSMSVAGRTVSPLAVGAAYKGGADGNRAGPVAIGWDGNGRLLALRHDGTMAHEGDSADESGTRLLREQDGVAAAALVGAAQRVALSTDNAPAPTVVDLAGRPVPFRASAVEGEDDGRPAALALSEDGTHLLVGTETGWLRLVRGDETRRERVAPSSGLTAVALAPGGAPLAAARSGDGRLLVALADLGKRTEVATDGGNSRILAWSPDGTRIASPCRERAICIWAVTTAPAGAPSVRQSAILVGAGEVLAVAWSPDGSSLASADGDNQLHVWTLAPSPTAATRTMFAEAETTALAATADGLTLLAGSSRGDIALVQSDGDEVKIVAPRFDGPPVPIVAVALHPTEPRIAIASQDGAVDFRRLPDLGLLPAGQGSPVRAPLSAAAWLPARDGLAVGNPDGITILRQDRTPVLMKRPPGTGDIQALLFDAPRQRFVTTGNDDKVVAWPLDASAARVAFELAMPGMPDRQGRSVLVPAPDGTRIVAAGNDGLVLAYDLASGRIAQTVATGAQVDGVAISDGKQVILAVRPDRWIFLLALGARTPLLASARLPSTPRAVVYVQGRDAFAIGRADGAITLLAADPLRWRARAKAFLGK